MSVAQKDIKMEYLGGIISGTAASICIAPIMTVLDISIIRSQFQHTTLRQATKSTIKDLFTARMRWNPSFNIMCGAYGATFITANTVRVACKQTDTNPVVPMALATWGVKSIAMALKDRAYAMRLYTPSLIANAIPKPTFPTSSLMLFGARDAFTVSAAFTCKERVRDYMVNVLKMDTIMSEGLSTFGVIMGAQFISTPFHIWGLDKYVRPDASPQQRLQLIRNQFLTITAGRMIRIAPALGLGTYINDYIREEIEDQLEENFVSKLPPPVNERPVAAKPAAAPTSVALKSKEESSQKMVGEEEEAPRPVRIQRRTTIRG